MRVIVARVPRTRRTGDRDRGPRPGADGDRHRRGPQLHLLPVRPHLHRGGRHHGRRRGTARHAESADPHRHIAVPGPHIARGRIGETQLKAARAMGVTGTEIAELVGNPALNILTNYRHFLANTKTAWPLVTPHARA